MTRIRIQKNRQTRKRVHQMALEAIGGAGIGSSELLDAVEELLEDIDQALSEARTN